MDASARLSNRLMWYGAAAAGVAGLAAAPDAAAQIIYTNPADVTVHDVNQAGTVVPVDFNTNADPELHLGESATAGSNYSFAVTNIDTGANVTSGGVINTVGGYSYWVPVAAGAAISAANVLPISTSTSYAQSFTYQGADPNGWLGGADKYMGVRFTLADGTHFGWVRLAWTAPGTYVLKDFAYNSVANAAINAGNTGTTAVEPGALAEGYLFSEVAPNPVVSRSTFNLAVGQAEHVRVDVIDVSGRQVATVLDQTLPAGELRTVHFDATSLPAGVYVVRVAGETFTTTRRVTVAH